MSDVTQPAERWAAIPGYEGYYEVSDQGRVRGLDRLIMKRSASGIVPVRWRGRMLRPKPTPDGHRRVTLRRDGAFDDQFIHVLVLTAFVGPRPDGFDACHNDGEPANNRLSNLRWDTRSGNMLDLLRHGRNEKANRLMCPRRHVLAEPNLIPSSLARGHRSCLACSRARAKAQHAKRLGYPHDVQGDADVRYAEIMAAPRRRTTDL